MTPRMLAVIPSLALMLCSTHAVATQCVQQTPEQVSHSAETVFTGKVLSVAPSDYSPRGSYCRKATPAQPLCGGKVATIEIGRVLKGAVANQITLLAEDGCACLGAYLEAGETYLIVADRNPTAFDAVLLARDVCWGTGPVSSELARQILEKPGASAPLRK